MGDKIFQRGSKYFIIFWTGGSKYHGGPNIPLQAIDNILVYYLWSGYARLGTGKYSVGIYIIFKSLKSKIKRDCFPRFSKDGQFNV